MVDVAAVKAMAVLVDLSAAGDARAIGECVLVDAHAVAQSGFAANLMVSAVVDMAADRHGQSSTVYAVVDVQSRRTAQAASSFSLLDVVNASYAETNGFFVLVDGAALPLQMVGHVWGLVDGSGGAQLRVGQQMLLLDARLVETGGLVYVEHLSVLVDSAPVVNSVAVDSAFVLADLSRTDDMRVFDLFAFVDASGVGLGMAYRLRHAKALVDGQAWAIGSV